MTEEQNASGTENLESNVSVQPAETSQAVNPAPVATQAEKMVPQSKVNEIVGATKKSAYEKAYQDAKAESEKTTNERNVAETNSVDEGSQAVNQNIGEAVQKEINSFFEKQQQATQKQEMDRRASEIITSLQSKVDIAAEKYEDFEEVTKDIPYSSFPHLLTAADSVDNAGDVLYHLGKNPTKFRELAQALDPSNPLSTIAIRELKALSDSLKNNETARQRELPRSPLSQIKPSSVSADSGKLTFADMKKRYLG